MNNAFATLTIPINAAVEGYKRAGMDIRWTWAELQLPCLGCNAEAGEECRWGCMSNVS